MPFEVQNEVNPFTVNWSSGSYKKKWSSDLLLREREVVMKKE
jgi:hypothetical protein